MIGWLSRSSSEIAGGILAEDSTTAPCCLMTAHQRVNPGFQLGHSSCLCNAQAFTINASRFQAVNLLRDDACLHKGNHIRSNPLPDDS